MFTLLLHYLIIAIMHKKDYTNLMRRPDIYNTHKLNKLSITLQRRVQNWMSTKSRISFDMQ